MFYAYRKGIAWGVLCVVFFSPIIFPSHLSALPYNALQTNSGANLETARGLYLATFETKAGNVTVHLPDDLAAGDTISGTVSVTPHGNNETEKRTNLGALDEFVIEVEETKTKAPASNKRLKLDLPNLLRNNKLNFLLRDKNNNILSRLQIAGNTTSGTQPSDYQLPSMGQTGRPVNIGGPFDGDLSNTSCSIGNKDAFPLAESPRKSVFATPADVVGEMEMKLKEGNTEITGQFRNIGVGLSAPKLNLSKGEQTTLTVKVTGLQGIKEDVSVELVCTNTINMEGGNTQSIKINPGNSQSDGSYTKTRTLTGVQAGGFNITATVQATQSCENGKKRNERKETKEFEYADETSVMEFSPSVINEQGVTTALTMVKTLRESAINRGSTYATLFVIGYLSRNEGVLEKLTDSPLNGSNSGVSAKLNVTIKKVKATCTSYEVCENGRWVQRKSLEQTGPTVSTYSAYRRAHSGDKEREKIENSSQPRLLDADRVDKWFRDFLESELNKLKKAKQDYDEFVKKCK